MMPRNRLVTGIIAGALVGTALGLLIAPKTGKETRQIVAMRGYAIKSKASDYFTVVRDRLKKSDGSAILNGASDSQEAII